MSASVDALRERIPQGAGLGLRPELWHGIQDHPEALDFVELVIDDYLDIPVKDAVHLLSPIRERFPLVAHGVSLSVASAHGIDRAYVEHITKLLDALGIELYSEHLSFRKSAHDEVAQFVPVPFLEPHAEHIAKNIREVQAITGRTLILENITYLLGHPEQGMGEAGFIKAVVEYADCGLLVDVTNAQTNAANLGYDPFVYIDSLPQERFVQGHIAGGHQDGRLYIDSHGHPVHDASYDLFAHVCEHSPLRTVLLERDKNYPAFSELADELAQLRQLLKREPQHQPHREVLPPLRTREAHVPKGIEDVPLAAYQDTLVSTLTTPGAYKALRHTQKDEVPQPLEAYLLSFPAEDVKAFTKILRFKRRENITSLLHGFTAHLGDALVDWLQRYFQAEPAQGRKRLDDALGFADFYIDHTDPSALRSLARHERTALSMRAKPYRFWHSWTERRTLTLWCDPKALDQALHGSLPPTLETPVKVRYIRKKQGIWVQPLKPKAPLHHHSEVETSKV